VSYITVSPGVKEGTSLWNGIIMDNFPPFRVLGLWVFSAIPRFRIMGDFPPFRVLGLWVIFRHSTFQDYG